MMSPEGCEKSYVPPPGLPSAHTFPPCALHIQWLPVYPNNPTPSCNPERASGLASFTKPTGILRYEPARSHVVVAMFPLNDSSEHPPHLKLPGEFSPYVTDFIQKVEASPKTQVLKGTLSRDPEEGTLHREARRSQNRQAFLGLATPSIIKTGFHYVGQAALELLTSGDPAAQAFQSAGITCVSHRAQPQSHFYMGLTLLLRLECSGTISAHYDLCFLGSIMMGFHQVCQAGVELLIHPPRDPPTSAYQSAGQRFVMLARLVSNSWPQVIRLLQPPKVLGLQ
ncbi:hypothetical protein AAY473_021668, partial [Plecturocebus cupreus]